MLDHTKPSVEKIHYMLISRACI